MGQFGAIIGGVHGGTTARTTDYDKERRDRQYAIDTMRYSQWTGMKPGNIKEAPSSREAAYQGMMSGFSGQAQPSSGSSGGMQQTSANSSDNGMSPAQNAQMNSQYPNQTKTNNMFAWQDPNQQNQSSANSQWFTGRR